MLYAAGLGKGRASSYNAFACARNWNDSCGLQHRHQTVGSSIHLSCNLDLRLGLLLLLDLDLFISTAVRVATYPCNLVDGSTLEHTDLLLDHVDLQSALK